MRKLFVAVAALAFLAPSAAHAVGFVSLRAGWARPSGDAQKGIAMRDTISSNVPIQLDAGLSMLNILSVGAYGSYAPTQLEGACSSCSGSQIRTGLELNLRPPLVLKSLWAGVFAGYERQWFEQTGRADVTYSGWETGVQGGWDFPLLPLFSMGPFVSYSVARYTSVTGAPLVDRTNHQYLTFGLRALFEL